MAYDKRLPRKLHAVCAAGVTTVLVVTEGCEMRRAVCAICFVLTIGSAHSGGIVPAPGVPAGSDVSSAVVTPNGWASTQTLATVAALANDPPAAVGRPALKAATAALASNTVYAAGTTTYASGTYTAAAGAQPIPAALAAGQVYFVNFPSANPGAASLAVGGLSAKPIKVLNSAGTALTLAGGEIVPGPATLYYDGTQFVYSVSGSQTISVSGATSATQANFANGDRFLFIASATLTLPCSSTISPNGQIFVAAVSGAATVAYTSGCTPTDSVIKNASSGTSQTVAQGAALAAVLTDSNGHYYVSGS